MVAEQWGQVVVVNLAAFHCALLVRTRACDFRLLGSAIGLFASLKYVVFYSDRFKRFRSRNLHFAIAIFRERSIARLQ